jgi:hypothetical protein
MLAIPMLTAEGTRRNERAAAENDPRSSTARNSSMLSLEKFIASPIRKTDSS